MVELIRGIRALVFGEKPRPIPALKALSDKFVDKLLEEKCGVVIITPKRALRWGRFDNVLIFKGMKLGVPDEILAYYREVCFNNLPDSKQTRRNRAELLLMAERRGKELRQLLPDLAVKIVDLDGKPMSTDELALIRAQADGMNISI